MSNPLHLITEEDFLQESEKHLNKLDNIVLALTGIAAGQGGHVSVTTWKQIQQIVRMGLAKKVFSVGDKFIVSKESNITISCSNSGVTATINAHTFVEAMGEAGNIDYEATYDGIEWHDGEKNIVLANYGITITAGTPEEGDKLVVHETASDIVFVVLGFDQERIVDQEREHSMTLGMLYTFDGVVFDAREAFFTNRTGAALPAGNYNFLLQAHSWKASDVGKYFQFTLTSDLPAGGQLVFQQAYDATLEGASVKVFASASTLDSAPTETVSLTEGRTGTYLGELRNSYDLAAEGTQKCFNHCQRALLGNNRWSQSAIRQWCNKDGSKGTFWTPQNDFDRHPSWHNTSDGKDSFLYNLDPELVSVLGKCKKYNELATCDRSDGVTNEDTEDLVWLLDRYEIQSCSSSEAVEPHKPYDYYHLLFGSTYGDWRTDSRFIKTNKAGTAQYWWLRSPNTDYGNMARSVGPSGGVHGTSAHYGTQAAVVFAII